MSPLRVVGSRWRHCAVFFVLLRSVRLLAFCCRPSDVLFTTDTATVGERLDDVKEAEHHYQNSCNGRHHHHQQQQQQQHHHHHHHQQQQQQICCSLILPEQWRHQKGARVTGPQFYAWYPLWPYLSSTDSKEPYFAYTEQENLPPSPTTNVLTTSRPGPHS